MNDTIIGIDLGTTNSEVATIQDGKPYLIKDNGKAIIPSVVGLSPEGNILVGEEAKNQFILYPERTIKSIKRNMGTNEKITLGDKVYLPQEISAIILKKLKQIAERHLGFSVSKAVITVPAYFSDAQRQATRDAGEIAGLDVIKLVNEPTAAALVYESDLHISKKILVYDLGGGTFDVSVVQIQNDVVEVLAGHGDNHLGGDDFDKKILDEIKKRFNNEHGIDLDQSRKALARVIRAVEGAKIRLSDAPFAQIDEEYILEKNGLPLNLSTELSRDDYEQMIALFMNETLRATHIALQGAKLKSSDIDEIILVGGATRTPFVHRILEENLKIKPRHEMNPDLCVAMGAAMQGALISGQQVSTVLVDITPYTFGTSAVGFLDGMTYNHMFCPIIKKNSAIPITKSDVFYTMVDNQEQVVVGVYEGENKDALKNIEIGKFMVEGLSAVPAGSEIICKFQLDLNGILHVYAEEKQSGLKKSISIENAFSHFDKNEIHESKMKVSAMFGKPVEEPEPLPEHSEVISESGRLIKQAQSKLDGVTDEDRIMLNKLIESAEGAVSNNDENALVEINKELSELLFYLED